VTAREEIAPAEAGSGAAEEHPRLSRTAVIVLGIALVFVAFNLRTPIASLPTLLSDIRRDIPLTGALAGVLTALPLLCMSWLAPVSSRLTGLVGYPFTTLAAVGLIAAGSGLRGLSASAFGLLAATFVAGTGIALLGIVLPAVVKDVFRHHEGIATGAYTVALTLGAAAAGAMSDPLAVAFGSWRKSLAWWAIPALVAIVVWLIALRFLPSRHPAEVLARRRHQLPWRNRTAWLLTAYMTAQSSLAYAFIAWLAPAYVERGWSAMAAGSLYGMSSVMSLIAVLAFPAVTDRAIGFRTTLMVAVGFTLIGTAWLWALPDVLPWVSVALFGVGTGAGFSLGLTRVVTYASDAQSSSTLTAMIFLVCYSVTAIVPVSVGALHDATGAFTTPFGLLVILAVVQLFLASRLTDDRVGTVH